jgi:hypothetical protein
LRINWMRFAVAVIASGAIASLTDWLFMGDLLYKRYNKYPEIWRHAGGSPGESLAIAWSAPLPFMTCAVFAAACEWLKLHSFAATFELALVVWLIAALPCIFTMALFIKLQPMIAASYSAGWLVKLTVAALGVGLILR